MTGNSETPVVPFVLMVPRAARLWIGSAILDNDQNCLLWYAAEDISQERFVQIVEEYIARDRPGAAIATLTLQCIDLRPNEGISHLTINGAVVSGNEAIQL